MVWEDIAKESQELSKIDNGGSVGRCDQMKQLSFQNKPLWENLDITGIRGSLMNHPDGCAAQHTINSR
jgi:hypothetical protein